MATRDNKSKNIINTIILSTATRVHESAEPDASGADGKELRQHRDQASVGTFVAEVEEIGKNTEALGRKVPSFTYGGGITDVSYVDAWEVLDLMRACDIVVVPSRNEPFGIVVLEAWAAGKPVVATVAGGPREFVRHDVNGFLVDASPGGLAHGIGSLLANRDHCRRLGANGRGAVEEQFNWNNVAAYTEGVYHVALR